MYRAYRHVLVSDWLHWRAWFLQSTRAPCATRERTASCLSLGIIKCLHLKIAVHFTDFNYVVKLPTQQTDLSFPSMDCKKKEPVKNRAVRWQFSRDNTEPFTRGKENISTISHCLRGVTNPVPSPRAKVPGLAPRLLQTQCPGKLESSRKWCRRGTRQGLCHGPTSNRAESQATDFSLPSAV